MLQKTQAKKRPPYSKPLFDLITSGYKPLNDVKIFIGQHAWKKAASFSCSYPNELLIVPPWLSPYDYDYPVNGCDTLIFDTGYADDSYLEDLIYCLFQDGASIVRSISPFHVLTVYKKDF